MAEDAWAFNKRWLECTNNAFSNFRAFMKPTFILCVTLACGLLQNAWAEKADRNKPMHIESDSMRYEDAQQLTVFTGKVVATKGSIVIRGSRVELRQDPEGNQFGTVTGAPKERAFFRQKREGLDEFIEGEAETLIYNGKTDTVRFETNAVMRRFRGSTLADEVTGAIINYENTTEKFSVDGSAAGAAPGRVRAVITPKPETSNPAKNP
jgi:lipopolysaccharide export system protein LptA